MKKNIDNLWVSRSILVLVLWAMHVTGASTEIEAYSRPFQTIEIAAAESGIIQSVEVAEGDSVVAGQAVVALDDAVLQAARLVAEAKVKSTGRIQALQAELEARERKLATLEDIAERGAARSDEVDRARSDVKIAAANLQAEKEALEVHRAELVQINAQIERRKLRSPVDGVVLAVNQDVGESVTAMTSELLIVADLSHIRVIGYATWEQAMKLSPGTSVHIDFFGAAVQAPGKIDFVSPVADAESGLYKISVRVKNPDGKLPCGVRCRIVMPTD
jgi:RND family efflux transporter MFP subunit